MDFFYEGSHIGTGNALAIFVSSMNQMVNEQTVGDNFDVQFRSDWFSPLVIQYVCLTY